MALTDFHLIHINSINGETSFSLAALNNDVSLQGLLLQTIIKRILTVPGSDAAYPQIGSNIGALYGTMSIDEANQARAMFPIFLKTIEDEVIEEQDLLSTSVELEPGERLKSLRLHSLEYDEVALGWFVKILVVTQSENQLFFTL